MGGSSVIGGLILWGEVQNKILKDQSYALNGSKFTSSKTFSPLLQSKIEKM